MEKSLQLPWSMKVPWQIKVFIGSLTIIGIGLSFLSTGLDSRGLVIGILIFFCIWLYISQKINCFEDFFIYKGFGMRRKIEWDSIERVCFQKVGGGVRPIRIFWGEKRTLDILPLFVINDLLIFLHLLQKKAPKADVDPEVVNTINKLLKKSWRKHGRQSKD